MNWKPVKIFSSAILFLPSPGVHICAVLALADCGFPKRGANSVQGPEGTKWQVPLANSAGFPEAGESDRGEVLESYRIPRANEGQLDHKM